MIFIQNMRSYFIFDSSDNINFLRTSVVTAFFSNINFIWNLLSQISNNKKEISNLEKNIVSENDKLENAEGMIRSAIHQRNTYTETIGVETIEKVREKAEKKAEKGKHITQ